jgi:hypothetical protein
MMSADVSSDGPAPASYERLRNGHSAKGFERIEPLLWFRGMHLWRQIRDLPDEFGCSATCAVISF